MKVGKGMGTCGIANGLDSRPFGVSWDN